MHRLGIFGGTFDPPHNGHLVAASAAREALELDEVWFVVAGDPWQKQGTVVASAKDRFAMAEVAVADVPGLRASDIEVQRPGLTYTVDTLRELRAQSDKLYLILGLDAAARITTWKEGVAIADLATLIVLNRGDEPELALGEPWDIVRVEMPRLDISSTDLRSRVEEKRPIAGLVPPQVIREIAERGLYTQRSG